MFIIPVLINNLSLGVSLLTTIPQSITLTITLVKAMDCGIIVSEFVLQSRYYVHFWANTLGKGMNPLILPAMGQIVPLLFF